MDEKRGKQELVSVSITSELILRVSNLTDFSKITSLNFSSKAGKIRVIENLSECSNLQVLVLSYHFISKIENLDSLTRLKELDLSENRISRFENLHKLTLLEVLNLSGNAIKDLPKGQLEPLRCLKTLKISKNKISSLQDLGNLSVLPNLENLFISGNSVCENEDYKLYLIYYLNSLESLDGDIVNTQLRQKATKKHAGPSPEVWVVRENLVSFRRTLSEKDQNKKEKSELISAQEKKAEKMRVEIEDIEKTLEKFSFELENIENALMNTPESQETRNFYLKDLIEKVETLQKSSVEMQEKMSEARTAQHRKQDQVSVISRQLDEGKSVDRAKLVEDQHKLQLDIEELEDAIYGYEQEYALLVENLDLYSAEMTKIEEDLIKKVPEGFKKTGHKKELSFTLDSDTKDLLSSRKQEIIQQVPKLKARKSQLQRELEEIRLSLEGLMLEFRDAEREIVDVTRQISDCEEYLNKLSSPSPMRNRNNVRQMWDSVKGLWQLLTDNPWEYETDDIQKGIIRWSEHMKEHVARHKIDHDNYTQILSQQKIDQNNISNLNTRIQELTEQLLSRSALSEENDRLHARIDAYKDREKKWNHDQNQLIEKIRKLEGENLFGKEAKNVEVLKLEQESLRASTQENLAKVQKEEAEIKARIAKLASYCDEKAEELHDFSEKIASSKEELKRETKDLQELGKSKNETFRNLEVLKKTKEELEIEIAGFRDAIKQAKPLKQAEDERDKAALAVKTILNLFKVNADFANVKELTKKLEETAVKLEEDLEKIEKFKVNKQKFVDMYENNTQELQTEWEVLKKAKDEFEFDKVHLDSLKNDKKTLDEQMKHLVSTTKDLQRVKNNLEKDCIKLEEHLNSLKQSISTFEVLKQKEMTEYSRIQSLNEAEIRKIEESIQELKSLKSRIKEAKSEKLELESGLSNNLSHLKKLEDSKSRLEQEISEKEVLVHRLTHRLTEEHLKSQKELEKINLIIDARQQDVKSLDLNLKSFESQVMKTQEQVLVNNTRLGCLSEEINEKETDLRDKKNSLRELEARYMSAEAALERARKETEMLNQSFTLKKQKLSSIDLEISCKSAELEKIQQRHDQGSAELANIEKQILRIKSDLIGIEQIITSKNNEYNSADSSLRTRQAEMRELDKIYSEKKLQLSRIEEDFVSIHSQARAEEEAIFVLQEESKTLQMKIAKLNEVLKRVESQKSAVLKEIESINAKVVEDEIRHRSELDSLRNAVGNGEATLRQLMESIQRCRNKLAGDKEESCRISEEILKLEQEREIIQGVNQELLDEGVRLRAEIKAVKEEEDQAIVLLALSGHKIDDRVKQRITSLCRAATELEVLKASMQEGLKENRELITDTRMRQGSRIESYESLSMFENR